MTIYEVHFADGQIEIEVVQTLATEAFRKQHGGKTQTEVLLDQLRKKYGARQITKVIRKMTGETVWEAK